MQIVVNEAASYEIPAAWEKVDRQTRIDGRFYFTVIDGRSRDRMADAISMQAYPPACYLNVLHI